MKKFAIAAIAALAFTAPALADNAMMIGDYPTTLAEVEYCWKARMDKDITLPRGCKTLGERILADVTSK